MSNPFSTKFVRPRTAEFLLPDGWSFARLLELLKSQGWWGEIVGPHGSGKSTLIHSLLGPLVTAGRQTVLFQLNSTERRLPAGRGKLGDWSTDTQVIVDGFEQLSRWRQRQLIRCCRRSGAGLLISAHESRGLPRLWTAEPTVDAAKRIVQRLAIRSPNCAPAEADVAKAFYRHNGNLREMLFDLYDWYEQHARGVDQASLGPSKSV